MSNKVRVSVLLEPETIVKLEQEAKEKSISLSAVIRQKVVGVGFSMDAEKLSIKFENIQNKRKREG